MTGEVKQKKSTGSSYKIGLFKVVAVLFPFIILLLLELALRLFGYGHNLNLFVQDEQHPDCFVVNPHLSERYFTITENATIGNFESFKKQKPKGTVRLFVLGESTTIGFPYMHNGSFHRWLKYRLLQLYPETDFEVINLAFTAVNSYTVRDIGRELIPYQPDAVLIYCGHNEYYGALGAASTSNLGHNSTIIRALIALKQYRLIQLLFNGYHAIFSHNGNYSDVHKTLMERMAADQNIPVNSTVYKSGINQFAENINAVCQTLSNHSIPALLSTIVSNEKDLKPFISDSKQSAMQVFLHANEEYASGKFTQAKASFIQAKELDLLRFRAPEAINRQIIQISKRYPLVTLVDSRRVFEQHSPHGIIDKNTMLEHVHPNLNGYALLSEAFFQALSRLALFKLPASGSMTLTKLKDQMPVTLADSCFGAYSIALLRKQWPFNESIVLARPVGTEETVGYEMAANGLKWNDAMDKLMTYYQQVKDSTKMLKVAEAVMLEYPLDPTFYAFAGKLCEQTHDLVRVSNYLNRAFRIRPGMDLAQELFSIELKQKHLSKAIYYIDYGLTQQPNNPKLQNVKQMLQRMTGLTTERREQRKNAYTELASYYGLLGAAEVAGKYRRLAENSK
ncbi:hypothetical protein SNE25_08545 [Mucilaginibacter sabulilitoris]|uniref:SGNH hydrolase-type esterase domain-containing protein n=1 Tax=Mucilaginibacter sabulilitoris TaxID=1173583 RepID=A0ABZ0TVT6_9SPHI|nr:hypothetical protein [Mucilaginibacter sabulilitoris]WPU95570.1 hypothetical protein SNE25_08545 [Mucilaginibacter sabulilitoris]